MSPSHFNGVCLCFFIWKGVGGEGMLGQLALDRHLKDMKHMDSCPLSALLELSFPAPRSYPAMPGCSHAAGGDLLTHS